MMLLKCCVFSLVLYHFDIIVSSDLTTEDSLDYYTGYEETEDEFTTDGYTTENSMLSEETADNMANLSVVLKMATVCETPNGDVGYCLGVRQCPKLYKQLSNLQARNFLRESMCGPQNEDIHNPKVCCGKLDNYRTARKYEVEDDNIFPKQCGNQRMFMTGRIIGGTEAALGEFPWLARIVHKNVHGVKSFGCSGFLIHTKYILTAAHCVVGEGAEIRGPVFSVVLGDHNSETKIDCTPTGKQCADPLQISRSAKVIAHPKYDSKSNAHYNDIALVHLNKGARITEYVKPICLSTDPMLVPKKYFLSGWGRTETEDASPIKMKIDIPSFDKPKCEEKYSLLNIDLLDSQICAGGENARDSCTGDSGGPLMMTPNATVWYAAGIVSYGIGCGTEDWPGVYTSIPSFIPWIKQTIKENSLVSVKNKPVKKHRRKKVKAAPRTL